MADHKDGRRCRATAKGTGERCKRLAAPGALVCVKHGAGAPQVKAAAARRVAIEEAQRMVAAAGNDLDPVEHLLDTLRRAYALVLAYGDMLAGLDAQAAEEALDRESLRGELGYLDVTADDDTGDELVVLSRDRLLALDRSGHARLHPYAVEYERALELRARFAKMCLDAGVAERLVSLQERQVELAHKAFEAMLDSLGLSAKKKQEARQTYARHLRAAS